MAVVPNLANAASTSGTGTSATVNVTCAASDNGLVALVGSDDTVTQAPPTSVTYNAVGMTLLGHLSFTSSYRGDVSIWYMANPPTGASLAVLATYANASTKALAAVPLSGVNNSITPVMGTGSNAASGTTASCAVTGAGANDLQLAACYVRAASIVSAGAPQAQMITPINNINAQDSFAADYIPGASAGNFSWTLPSGNWIGIGVTVFGTAATGGAVSGLVLLRRNYRGYVAGTIVQLQTSLQASLIAQGIASASAGPVTPGAVSTDLSMGRLGIAAAGTSVVLTNPNITTESKVVGWLSNAAADGTALYVTRITPAAGSVTFTLNAAATAAVSIDWVILA